MTHTATNKKGIVGEWDWEKEDKPFCYQPKEPKEEIAELNLQDKSITHMYIDMSKKIEKAIAEGRWDDLESLKPMTSRSDE